MSHQEWEDDGPREDQRVFSLAWGKFDFAPGVLLELPEHVGYPIAEGHGGSIRADNVAGGVMFEVSLPEEDSN